jgi:prepilin-type N-terminal cleavage/methylation domain-containing protein
MNMILKKQTASRGGRTGFTLVEVIVVLVILAILAAIAIPALTGYIDKARMKNFVMQAKTQMTAVQTMITEQRVDDGGITTYAGIWAGDYPWFEVRDFKGKGYQFYRFTQKGVEEYEKLTGDTSSFFGSYANTSSGQYAYPDAYCGLDGSIKGYAYTIQSYSIPSTLYVIYLAADVSDPVTSDYLQAWENAETGTSDLLNPGGWAILEKFPNETPKFRKLY